MASENRVGILLELLGVALLLCLTAEFFRFSTWWEIALAIFPSAVFLVLRIPVDGRRRVRSWWVALGIGFLLCLAVIFARISCSNG
jgi:uncharacterized membrane protein